jgi:hypothetical protein
MQAKEPIGPSAEAAGASSSGAAQRACSGEKPLLMVDVDGVISLFGVSANDRADERAVEGSFHSVEGIPHFLSSTAAAHLLDLRAQFELVWASGWEERADEHLPHLLGLPKGLPFLRFSRSVGRSNAHWKLEAIEAHAAGRALAWIDDALDGACRAWARERAAPTLLVQTEPGRGLTAREARLLAEWARGLALAR